MNERHPFDPYPLVFGLFFTGFGAAPLFGGIDLIDLEVTGVVGIGLLFTGSLLLAAVWRRRSAASAVSPETEPSESPTTPLPPP